MKCVVPSHFSGTLFKNENKTFSFLLFFSCNLYISLISTTDFCKVPYYEDLESEENMKIKRSTTSIKTQGVLYPCEVVVSFITDSSINRILINACESFILIFELIIIRI
jgi:hypothetical protein